MKKNEIPKPFKSGKCQPCHSPELLSLGELCSPCEEYASQDHVPNKVLTMGSGTPKKLKKGDPEVSSWEAEYESFDPLFYRNRFYVLLKDTGISAQQRQIVKLFFCEGLTKIEISKRLEISRSSLQNQFDRALEKLEICRTNPLLVKERKLRVKRPRSPIKPRSKETILPVKFFQPDENGDLKLTQIVYPTKRKHFSRRPRKRAVYQKCWRCGAQAFLADQDFYYCMDCSWNSDTYGGAEEPTEKKSTSFTESEG